MKDSRDLPITGADAATLSVLGRFTADFLGFRDECADIVPFAQQDTECPLAAILAAGLICYSQSRRIIARDALPLLARAEAVRHCLTPREALLVDAVAAWACADFATGIAALESLAAAWPRDVAAAKFAEFLFFQAPDFPRHLAFMERIAAANARESAIVAMHAFAHEQNRRWDAARDRAEAALTLDPDTPWAHHALGHLYLNRGETVAGLAALEGFRPSWRNHGRGIRAHNCWHIALLALAERQAGPAHVLYRDEIAGFDPGSAFEHTDAISLLWRLELADLPLPGAWLDFDPAIAERAAEPVFPFLNAHYVYALGRQGRGDLARHAIAAVAGTPGAAWRTGVPVLEGCLALAEDDPAGAAALLGPAMDKVGSIGGSDAQNDVFHQSYLVALLRAGAKGQARAFLERRLGGRVPTPLEADWLARAA